MLSSLSRIGILYPHFRASVARQTLITGQQLLRTVTTAPEPKDLSLPPLSLVQNGIIQKNHQLHFRSLTSAANLLRFSAPDFSLPVLDEMVRDTQQQKNPPNFKNIIFVCGQHLLLTTISLVKSLIALGAKPENIFMVGKPYSNNHDAVQELKKLGINYQPNSKQMALGGFSTAYNFDNFKMWAAALEHIEKLKKEGTPIDGMIALDDGGHVLENMPEEAQILCKGRIVGIEQTSSGVNSAQTLGCPTIEVATSAVKQIEPPMVAEIVARKLGEKLDSIKKNSPDFFIKSEPTIGVVGLGHIGQKVLLELVQKGYKKIAVFDKKSSNVEWAESLQKEYPGLKIYATEDLRDCIWSADILIGCTGTDITAGRMSVFQGIQNPKILISCSSKDVEFQTLLNYIQKSRKGLSTDPLDDIDFQNGFQSPIKIIRGGTPVNFDNGLHSVPPEDIQLIRGLKLAAVLQAFGLIQEWETKGTVKTQNYMVDPLKQQQVLSIWLSLQPKDRFDPATKNHLLDLQSIIAKSGGILYSNLEAPELQSKFRPFS
jgi:S-adenosylhomocysteine hydrolase